MGNYSIDEDYEFDVLKGYDEYYLKNFGTPKLAITRAKGSKVIDFDGKEYIDLLQGIAVNCLGHSNPELAQIIAAQANSLAHVSNFFTTKPQVQLAKKLAQIVGFEHNPRVLLTNSGTEAVEGALKIAKKHKPHGRIIALDHSFHGRTLGALSVTSKEKYRKPFSPLIPDIEFIEPNANRLRDAFSDNVSAVILEVIQGEAGVVPIDADFIKAARKLTQKHGALLIIDEVQTGIGRTGKWFAYQHTDIVPDIITSAKSLGGGFPIGAVITTGTTGDVLVPGDHGTTFGGNPLAAATALKVLQIIERDNLLSQSAQNFPFVKEILENHQNPYVKEIRGQGSLIGIELTSQSAAQVADKALENGLIVNACNPSTIRLAPAYNIGIIELRSALIVLDRTIRQVLDLNYED
ncbi:acetylornithine aminotransferase [Actinomycetota bacterium]|nr:acetylornithine aminotransferase [Actinomycetota bacterium]